MESIRYIGVTGIEVWKNAAGRYHREDGPAIKWHTDQRESWYYDGEVHREGGPAMTMLTGALIYYHHGNLHREDGPAIIGSSGEIEWHAYGEEYREIEDWACAILSRRNQNTDAESINEFLKPILQKLTQQFI